MAVVCWQNNAAALSLYVSVIHSLADVVGVRQLLADSAMNNLLQRIVRPPVCSSFFTSKYVKMFVFSRVWTSL